MTTKEPVPEARVRSALASIVVPPNVAVLSTFKVDVVDMAPAQAKAPEELVKVQPVDPEPPPKTKSPVAVPFKLRGSVPLESMERAM